MKKLLRVFVVGLLLILSFAAYATGITASGDEFTVLLPVQANVKTKSLTAVCGTVKAQDWKAFSQKNGGWSLMIDRATGTPRCAFGEPVKIAGFSHITGDNVEEASRQFLRENQELFGIDINNIKMIRKDLVNGKWYVSFRQYYKGLEVLLSRIELRIVETGKVMAFDIEYFNNIGISTVPALSAAEAAGYADEGIGSKVKTDKILTSDKAFILPVKSGSSVEYRLVYNVEVKPTGGFTNYSSYVDANSGEVVWRYKTTQEAVSFSVQGGIKLKSPMYGADVYVPFSGMNFQVGNKTFTSDSAGIVHCGNITDMTNISADFSGRWVKITGKQTTISKYYGTLVPGNPFEVRFSDLNSHTYERNQFYHTNYIHDFYKRLDPQLTCLDTQFNVVLDYEIESNSSPNAYSNGAEIVFICLSDPSGRFPEGPSILFHEYGHSINTLFYKQKGIKNGMANSTLHEAIADMTSAFLLDEPEVGKGYYTNSLSSLRNLKNTMIYPDSMIGEGHYDSQILSGAMWDLRERTSLKLVNNLLHFARYGLVDGEDVGVLFYLWLLETLIADDDDGNLANGTPHYKDIIECYHKHNIGPELFYINNFSHTCYENTDNCSSPYNIEFDFGDSLSVLGGPDSLFVEYRVIYGGVASESKTVPAVSKNNDMHYTAAIPPQKKYSIVKYFIKVYNSGLADNTTFGDVFEANPFVFLVGFNTVMKDDFESAANWSVGSQEDNAKHGIWERGEPYRFDLANWGVKGDYYFKPGENHTPNGNFYYSTGLTFSKQYANNQDSVCKSLVPDGITTLTSPVFDLTQLNNAYIEYYLFYKSYMYFIYEYFGYKRPVLITQLSNNGGQQWVTIDVDSMNGFSGWRKKMINFGDYLTKTSKCMIRLRYKVQHGYRMTMGSATIDDFEILTDEPVNSVDGAVACTNALPVYPNPFIDHIRISYESGAEGLSSITISSLQGELIYQNEMMSSPGINSFVWDGTDRENLPVPRGMYIYRIVSGNRVFAGKLTRN